MFFRPSLDTNSTKIVEEWKSESNLRGTLPNVEEIWKYNNDTDLYQRKKRGRIRGEIERDHVLEIQICNKAFDTMEGRKTRGQHEMFKGVINSLNNTNNTTRIINQKKKGPFVRWINNYDTSDKREVGRLARDHA